MIEEFERKKRPKVPKKITENWIYNFFGIISPALLQVYSYFGDKEVSNYLYESKKYNNYKRKTTRAEWKAFYRDYRMNR